jgi:hypothetical protein
LGKKFILVLPGDVITLIGEKCLKTADELIGNARKKGQGGIIGAKSKAMRAREQEAIKKKGINGKWDKVLWNQGSYRMVQINWREKI